MTEQSAQLEKHPVSRRWNMALLGLLLLSLAGCTPEKARAIRMAANQFRAQAYEAMGAIQELMDSEIAAAPRTETQKTDEFISNILTLGPGDAVTPEIVEFALDPYSISLSSGELAGRQVFQDKLRNQYATFASIFDSLEKGSFLARDKIGPAKRHAAALTAQLAGFAESISRNPPRLHQLRSAIIAEMDRVRKDSALSSEQRRQQLASLKERWEELKVREHALQRAVVEKCLKAAMTGDEIVHMVDNYSKLSLDDISNISGRMMSAAEFVSGRNLDDLRSRSGRVLDGIKGDPLYREVVEIAIKEVQGRAAK